MLNKIVKELTALRLGLALVLALVPVLLLSPMGVLAATSANITINATPAYVAITCNVSFYDFGVVAAASTTNTSNDYFGVTNLSTVQTDQTLGANQTTWQGGLGWDHSDAGTAGDNTTAIYSSNGTAFDIVVQNAAPAFIFENLPALQDYDFGLSLQAPTVLYDGAEKTIGVVLAAVAG